MRKLTIIAATAVTTALITVWSLHALGTTSPADVGNRDDVMGTTASVNIMQLMRDAKDLPVQSYDACACAF